MTVQFRAEYRGMEERTSKKGNPYKVYHLEDECGATVSLMGDLPILTRGIFYHFHAEYDPRWKSLRLTDAE